MSDIDTRISELLDVAGVPKVEVEEPKKVVSTPPQPTDKKYAKLANEHKTLLSRFSRAKKREDELKATIKVLRDNDALRRKAAAKKKDCLRQGSKSSPKGRVTTKHPDCNLVVRLSDNRIMIVFDEQFFVTSLPLNEAEDNNVVLNGKCVDFLQTLDEYQWINEQCGLLGRLWRIEANVPLVVDYVDDAPLKALLKKEGVTKLHDAYLKSQEGMKGLGPKRQQLLKAAYDEYSKDLSKHRKSGKSVVIK